MHARDKVRAGERDYRGIMIKQHVAKFLDKTALFEQISVERGIWEKQRQHMRRKCHGRDDAQGSSSGERRNCSIQ
jgi:hypothetical protein